MSVEFMTIADFILKLLSAFSTLVKGHSTQKKEFFENHIEPLQERMILIHQDYINGFQDVRRLIKDGSKPPNEVIEFLLERSREFDSHRELSLRLAEEIEKARKLPIDKKLSEAVSSYCNSIVDYLYEGNGIAEISWYTDFICHVRARSNPEFLLWNNAVWDDAPIAGNPRGDLLQVLDSMLDKLLPAAFDKVNAKYARLRVQLL